MTIEDVIDQINRECALYARAGFKTITFYATTMNLCASLEAPDKTNDRLLVTVDDTAGNPPIRDSQIEELVIRIQKCIRMGLLQD